VASLPEDQQTQLMQAIQQTEAQLNGEAVEPALEGEPVPAGEFVQSEIAHPAPELDEQLAAAPSEDDSPTVEGFRAWYRATRTLGRSEEALSDIAAIGRSAKAGDLAELGPVVAQQNESGLSTGDNFSRDRLRELRCDEFGQ
jgi:hypothetical protein